MIKEDTIRETVVELLEKAVISLPDDVVKALSAAHEREEGIARTNLKAILDNIIYARKSSKPLCQDTGLPVFYVRIGSRADVDLGHIENAIRQGVRDATKKIPLRSNVVHPLTRKNSGDNTGEGMPAIEFEMVDAANFLEITVLPKGAGSENMSALKMLTPSAGLSGVKRFVLETVAAAGGNPCPPTIIGVGIGGTADESCRLSKKALLRTIGSRNKDADAARLEEELFKAINGLGIGPMGLGGKTTSLAVHVEYAFCHTASLPVAVSIQCWANRRATARILGEKVVFL